MLDSELCQEEVLDGTEQAFMLRGGTTDVPVALVISHMSNSDEGAGGHSIDGTPQMAPSILRRRGVSVLLVLDQKPHWEC